MSIKNKRIVIIFARAVLLVMILFMALLKRGTFKELVLKHYENIEFTSVLFEESSSDLDYINSKDKEVID